MAAQTEITRDTMEATAKEGVEFLEKASPVLAEKCKAVMKEAVENGAGDAPEVKKNGDSPVKIPRDNTVVTTAEEGKECLEEQEGVNADAKTRAQEIELSNEEKENDEKSATKRSAEAQDEEEVDEAKKQKTEETKESENDEQSVAEKESAPEEAAAE